MNQDRRLHPSNKASSVLPSNESERVIVVSVTYGERERLLRQVLDAVRGIGVTKVVVVDNGAAWPIKSELTIAHHDFVDVVEMGENTGSAKGYATGIKRALDLGADYIWLLDDDNCPQNDTLPVLLRRYEDARRNNKSDIVAVMPLRPIGQEGVPLSGLQPRHSSYCGFHIADLPRKVSKRIFKRKSVTYSNYPPTASMEVSPYSGLLFKATLIEQIGLPNIELVLYCDDYDWSYRIVEKGGLLQLVTDAKVIDIQPTWGQGHGNKPLTMLLSSSNSVAYYAMRNEVYFYSKRWCQHRTLYEINRICFLVLLWMEAILHKRLDRFRLLQCAANDGEQGRLGMNSEYIL